MPRPTVWVFVGSGIFFSCNKKIPDDHDDDDDAPQLGEAKSCRVTFKTHHDQANYLQRAIRDQVGFHLSTWWVKQELCQMIDPYRVL